MDFSAYINTLHTHLKNTLPGEASHHLMAPSHRRTPFLSQPQAPLKAGVLLLIYPSMNDICLLAMKRPNYKGHHGGQISLPGGKKEKTDKTIQETALRETHEELGVSPTIIKIIGNLTPLLIPVSNFMVTPVVGYTQNKPSLKPNNFEVEKPIEVSINVLFNKETLKNKTSLFDNTKIKIPYYDIAGDHIWGATAMILSEFIELNKQAGLIPE